MKITASEEVEITVAAGEEPELPEDVEVTVDDEFTAQFPVKWEELPADEPGVYEVKGEIVPDDYPSPLIEQRADPYIYRHTDGMYYFTGSYPEYDRIVLRRASTIEGLKEAEEKVVWRAHESGIMSEHIWAPEIHYIEGAWYIHFAAGEKESVWDIRPYVLECKGDPLQEEWVEKGAINTEFKSFSLDATTFEHQGNRYLIWAQKVKEETISNMYIAKMDTPWSITGKQVLLSEPEYDWETEGFDVNEGPAVLIRNGYVFVAFSASATDDRYVMGLLHAKEDADLLDPSSWTKEKEPVFKSSVENGEFGPGHNSFTVTEDGKRDLLVYHARPYKEIEGNPLYDPNRHARVQRMFWKDGFPYFAEPGYRLDASLTVKATVTVKDSSDHRHATK